jgi:5-methyltetrahydrofolate--homocysteine methyltransferase
MQRVRSEAAAVRERSAPPAIGAAAKVSAVKREPAPIPSTPFWGVRTIEEVPVDELWPCFDLRSLYRLSWGAGNAKGDAFDRIVRNEFEPRLHRYQRDAAELLRPRVAYGYFPAAGRGNELLIYDPQRPTETIASFAFPRQVGGDHLSLADYFREPKDNAATDVVALQVVTVGDAAGLRSEMLQHSGDYGESYFVHGFGVQSAEALAEWTHRRIRRELGLDDGRGKRYSWGYGACPDLSQHETVWRLLDAQRRIGVALTSAFQIVPEQSTAAIVVHHPKAAYFNAAAMREIAAS